MCFSDSTYTVISVANIKLCNHFMNKKNGFIIYIHFRIHFSECTSISLALLVMLQTTKNDLLTDSYSLK